MRRLDLILSLPLLALALGGCSLGQGLTTGSVFGGQQANAGAATPPPPKPATAEDRTTQVAATSARAERCGFNFNPDRLRANFLAAEAAATPPVDMSQRYDVTRRSVIAAIVSDEGYCTEGRTRAIKADLGRHLAGDFSPVPKKPEVASGWLDSGPPGYRQRETINPEILDDPRAKRTRRVEE